MNLGEYLTSSVSLLILAAAFKRRLSSEKKEDVRERTYLNVHSIHDLVDVRKIKIRSLKQTASKRIVRLKSIYIFSIFKD